jgi:DNA-binding XRE family transcriptional regulator
MKREEIETKKEDFLRLRAVEGKSFDSIAKELKVSKQTLINWSKELESEIKNLRLQKYESLMKELKVGRFNKIKFYCEQYIRLREEFAGRDLKDISTKDILNMLENLDQKITITEGYDTEQKHPLTWDDKITTPFDF